MDYINHVQKKDPSGRTPARLQGRPPIAPPATPAPTLLAATATGPGRGGGGSSHQTVV
jgi:hypothetical protein